MNVEVLAITAKDVVPLRIHSLTAIGGAESSGIVIDGLRLKGEYAVLTPAGDKVILHALKGKASATIELSLYQRHAIEDLTLVVVHGAEASAAPSAWSRFPGELAKVMSALADPEDLEKSLDFLLETLLNDLKMDKGVTIVRNAKSDFQVIAQRGVNPNEQWLSETLVLDALTKKQTIVVQNVIGSPYHSNKSLTGTGFLSVFAWPLMVRGDVLGVLLTGSKKPHSGLSDEERSRAEMMVQLAALTLGFHLRDLRQREELAALRRESAQQDDLPLLTECPALIETCRVAKQVAATDLAVLIQGETGVGKEVLTQWIHRRSDRKNKPFVVVNCGAIPSELLESLLFGHRKGAFTGADADRAGKFQLAHGGTLFLDEIGDLPEYLQVKLLRAIQEKVVEPVGGSKPVPADVRVLSASHKSLSELVSKGKFREDLYYRLAEVTLEIPPLRERAGDIKLLAASFRKKYAPDKRFAPAVLPWLTAQDWKGNVRELLSTIRRAAILASGPEIQLEDLTTGVPRATAAIASHGWLGGENLEGAKTAFVQEKVREALRRAGGKRAKAAELLGVTQRTFFRYLEDLRSEMGDNSVGPEGRSNADGADEVKGVDGEPG